MRRLEGRGSVRDRVTDGRNLMNVGRVEDTMALLSYYRRKRDELLALAPRAPFLSPADTMRAHLATFRAPGREGE